MIVFISVSVILFATWLYIWRFSYWKSKGIPFVETRILFGNLFSTPTCPGIILKNMYDLLKKQGYKHGGYYLLTQPRYLPIDINIIKCILVQDFNKFSDRGYGYNEKDDPLTANLFMVGGERWKSLRSKLTPAFSIGKLKKMLDPLLMCGNGLKDVIAEIEANNRLVDAKVLSRNFSINVIALCVFGIDEDCFKNPNSEFIKICFKTFDYRSWRKRMKVVLGLAMPKLATALGITIFGEEYTRFYTNLVKETIDYREKCKVTRHDLIQLLIALKNNVTHNLNSEASKHCAKGATIEELAAQVFVFFAAGFETTFTTLYFCLYELALNFNIQKKVRNEINNVLSKYNGNLTYEALSDMKYVNQVIDETLRKYPPAAFITRKCEQAFKIPNTNLILDKDTGVDISVLGIHHNPEFYPDPESFDPERFSQQNKNSRPSCSYLPFGEGPRTCVGMGFAIMELKVGITVVLQQYELSLNEKTISPPVIEPNSFTLSSKSEIVLNIRKVG